LSSERFPVKTEIKIEMNAETSEIIIKSLEPEIETPVSDRSTIKISTYEKGIRLNIEAEDVVALRSIINSYLHWIQGLCDITRRIEKK
jgi:tRNA threonylcarbamoyladenosine modification (KEOPS) complex  Pcc1 subunit